jgi:tetratricopeptide (TPR) repeat protein
LYPQAFDAWVLAAQYDWKLMAIHDAIEACRRAERLIRRTSELTEAQIYKMYGIWNQIAFENDDFRTLESLNLSLKTLGQERESDLLIGAAFTGLSDAEMARNNFEKALEHAEQAITFIQNTDSLYEKARALERRGVYIYMLGRLSESQPSFWQALELTRDAKETLALVVRGNTFYQLAITETLRGYPLPALEHARQALATHQKTGNNYGKIAAYSVTAAANYLVINYTVALENALLGIELADRVEGWRMNGYLSYYAGMCEMDLGLLGQAWQHAQKAIEIGRRQGHGEIVGLGFRLSGDIYLHLGAVQKANDAYQQGLAAVGQHFVALELMAAFGFSQLLLGLELGRQFLLHAIHTASQAELGSIAILATIQELSMYLLSDEQELFNDRAAWLREQVINRTGRDVAGFYIDRILAETAFKKGDYPQALTLAQPCIAWYRNTQNCWAELSVLWIMEQSAQKLGLEQAPLSPRIQELLNKIANSLQNAPLQAEWQDFAQKMAL